MIRFTLLLLSVCGIASHGYSQDFKKVMDTLTYETQSGLPIAASKIYFSDSKFTISGYGETNYINYRGAKNTSGGDLELYMSNMQRFVMYAAYKPKKWLVLYGEIFAEYLNDGRNEGYFEFQPEFFVDFLIHEKINLRLGTHQLQLGYINNSDEPVMFYTVNRPEVERVIIPSTWIDLGVMAYGKINKDLKWSASVYQGLNPTDLRGTTWIRRGRKDALRFNFDGFTTNGSLKYTGIKHYELALNGLYAKMSDGTIENNTMLVSSYLRRDYKRCSFMALGALGRMDNTEGIYEITRLANPVNTGQILGSNVYGFYSEVGYDIWPFLKGKCEGKGDNFMIRSHEIKLPVFIRYERLNTHAAIAPRFAGEPVFQSDLTAITVGANFNPRRNIVAKANYQFRNNRIPLQDGNFEGNRVEFGLGFIF